jgi:ribosomal protein S1
VAFVDVGGKGEATIEIDELKDPDGDLEVAVGDRIQDSIISTSQRSQRRRRGTTTIPRRPCVPANFVDFKIAQSLCDATNDQSLD